MEVSNSCSTAFSRTSSICWSFSCGVTYGQPSICISTPMTRLGQITDRWYVWVEQKSVELRQLYALPDNRCCFVCDLLCIGINCQSIVRKESIVSHHCSPCFLVGLPVSNHHCLARAMEHRTYLHWLVETQILCAKLLK